ncbi:GAP family protein [Microlunatus sp. Gsoil 973]|uniref:GAP family protein n=1 Tax=Microlunatus sp. Gsoil 973 TaxID=2672569 RepID=UPI0018A84505|nr:GAP family protein [Microlunatus sp. Gsoil 973]
MWTAIGDTLPLAIGITLSPLSLIIGLVLLLNPRGLWRAAAYGFCWFLSILVVAGIAYNIVWVGDAVDVEHAQEGVEVLQLVLAGLCLGWAGVTWRRIPRDGEPAPESRLLRRLDGVGVPAAAGLGLAQGFVRMKNIFLAVAAGARFGDAELSRAESVIGLVIFALLATSGVLVPLIFSLTGSPAAPSSLGRARKWLETNMSSITIVVLLVIGVYLLGQGLDILD